METIVILLSLLVAYGSTLPYGTSNSGTGSSLQLSLGGNRGDASGGYLGIKGSGNFGGNGEDGGSRGYSGESRGGVSFGLSGDNYGGGEVSGSQSGNADLDGTSKTGIDSAVSTGHGDGSLGIDASSSVNHRGDASDGGNRNHGYGGGTYGGGSRGVFNFGSSTSESFDRHRDGAGEGGRILDLGLDSHISESATKSGPDGGTTNGYISGSGEFAGSSGRHHSGESSIGIDTSFADNEGSHGSDLGNSLYSGGSRDQNGGDGNHAHEERGNDVVIHGGSTRTNGGGFGTLLNLGGSSTHNRDDPSSHAGGGIFDFGVGGHDNSKSTYGAHRDTGSHSSVTGDGLFGGVLNFDTSGNSHTTVTHKTGAETGGDNEGELHGSTFEFGTSPEGTTHQGTSQTTGHRDSGIDFESNIHDTSKLHSIESGDDTHNKDHSSHNVEPSGGIPGIFGSDATSDSSTQKFNLGASEESGSGGLFGNVLELGTHSKSITKPVTSGSHDGDIDIYTAPKNSEEVGHAPHAHHPPYSSENTGVGVDLDYSGETEFDTQNHHFHHDSSQGHHHSHDENDISRGSSVESSHHESSNLGFGLDISNSNRLSPRPNSGHGSDTDNGGSYGLGLNPGSQHGSSTHGGNFGNGHHHSAHHHHHHHSVPFDVNYEGETGYDHSNGYDTPSLRPSYDGNFGDNHHHHHRHHFGHHVHGASHGGNTDGGISHGHSNADYDLSGSWGHGQNGDFSSGYSSRRGYGTSNERNNGFDFGLNLGSRSDGHGGSNYGSDGSSYGHNTGHSGGGSYEQSNQGSYGGGSGISLGLEI